MNELVKLIKVGFYLFQEAPLSLIDEFFLKFNFHEFIPQSFTY